MRRALVLAMAGLLAAGCPAVAQTAEDRETIIGSCLEDLQLSEAGCACVADQAEGDLDATTHHLFALALSDPTAMAAMAATTGFTPEQAQAMTDFVTTAPTQCARTTMQ